MTTRRNLLKQSLLAAGAASVPAGNLLAQEKMEEKRPKYNLPYKNTYLKIDPTQTESATETQTNKTEESNTQATGTATSTEAVVTGNATGTNATDASATEKASGSGCASVIGGASAVVMAAVAAAVALKKKH